MPVHGGEARFPSLPVQDSVPAPTGSEPSEPPCPASGMHISRIACSAAVLTAGACALQLVSCAVCVRERACMRVS